MHLATWRGVGLYVDPILFVFLGLVLLFEWGPETIAGRLMLVLVLLGSVLIHEIGHAWMARARGLRVTGVFLHLLPFAYVERGAPADEWRVALAGPAASLVTFAAIVGVQAATTGVPALGWDTWASSLLATAAGVNLLMGTINLVPVLPLDGGRAFRAVLMARLPAPTARRLTARVGTFVGVALMAVAVFLGRLPVSAYVALLGGWICIVAWREAAGRGAG